MPVYVYWGDDEYRLEQAVTALRDRVLDPHWASFNLDKITTDQAEAVIQGLNQAMTPPFGSGDRLVWLVNTTVCQQCSEAVLTELERTLPCLPETAHLLLTLPTKPDGRSKVTKLMQKVAKIEEFALIPPWKTDQLVQGVKQAARQRGVTLTVDALDLLAQAVGNDTRQLFSELEKLKLFAASSLGTTTGSPPAIDAQTVAALVKVTTHNSLQLATAILQGKTAQALDLVADLINQNEPALRIVATLVKQFRTWLWVKLMVEAGERDERAIAQAAQVSNPKRIYFLQQEVRQVNSAQLQQALPLLLDLELGLKRGGEEVSTLQSKVIELCQIYR